MHRQHSAPTLMKWDHGTKIEGTSFMMISTLPIEKEGTSISGTLNTLLGDSRLTEWFQKCSS